MRHPGVREDLRGTYAGLASDAGDRVPQGRSASPRSSCCRSTTSPTSTFLAEKGLTNYWGYSSIGYFAPHAALRGDRHARRAGARVQGHGQGAAPRGHRGDPRRRLQPHRRGQPPRARCSRFKGVDNTSYYRLVPDDPRFYMDFTGTGNSLNAVHPSVLRLIMDSLRYWVDRVPRRRLPLRPRQRARARALRRRPPVSVLRRHPPGPGAVPGQAHRRAVGRRPGRLPGRQLPRAVDRVERHLPRRDARLLARRGGRGRRSRALHRLQRPLRGRRPRARSRRSTSSPPTTASRCATSSPTTTSTTRPTSRTTATAPTTTARGTAASRAPTDDPEILALRARQQRNFLATLLLSQGVPMLLGGDEIGRTQGGNNNAWCQDNEISWFDWELDERGARHARLHAPADRAAPRAPGVPPARSFLRGEESEGSGLPDVWWFRPDGRQMTQRDWERGDARRRRVPQRRGDRGAATRTASASSTTRSCCSSTRSHEDVSSRCRPALRRRWDVELDDGRPGRRAGSEHGSAGARSTR